MLTQAIESYLKLRRAAGFALTVHESLLRHFARFAQARNEDTVRRQTAIDWAAQAPSPGQRERRLGVVRRFVEHARAEDRAHESVPQHVFAQKQQRQTPYLFSPTQLHELLAATRHLRPRGSLRPLTYSMLFGLLAVTGLRISEALHLTIDDVTADGLLVKKTKFKKSRLVPLHETTNAALQRYLEQRCPLAGSDNHVFISTQGKALTYPMVNGTFHFLTRFVTLVLRSGQRPPRIHDLRHLFAVRTLESYSGGQATVSRHILALSTYLGHAHVMDTYWYLQATPHLMASIATACEKNAAGGEP